MAWYAKCCDWPRENRLMLLVFPFFSPSIPGIEEGNHVKKYYS
jgi:hypothetical protein